MSFYEGGLGGAQGGTKSKQTNKKSSKILQNQALSKSDTVRKRGLTSRNDRGLEKSFSVKMGSSGQSGGEAQ